MSAGEKIKVEKRSTEQRDTYNVEVDGIDYNVTVTFINGEFFEIAVKPRSSVNEPRRLTKGEAKALFEVLKIVLSEEKLNQS
jgi:hypothetical protein